MANKICINKTPIYRSCPNNLVEGTKILCNRIALLHCNKIVSCESLFGSHLFGQVFGLLRSRLLKHLFEQTIQ